MSDSMTNDAFSGLAAKAEAMLGEMEAKPLTVADVSAAPTPVETTTVETPVVETKVEEPQATDPTTPQPLDVAPETPVRIKVNGEEKVVTAKEYAEILQRTDVFTQKQQALAKQRNEVEQYITQKEQEFLQREQQLAAYAQMLAQQGDPVQRLAQALQPQQEQKPFNPNEIATIGEVQQAILALAQQHQQELARVKAETQQELAAREHAQREAQMLAQDQKRVSDTLSEFFQSTDGQLLLQVNPRAEAVIRVSALQMGPQNTEEAIENVKIVAKGMVENVRGVIAKSQQTQAVSAAKTVMEPPSGTPPTLSQAPPKSALKKDGSIDWNLLRQRAMDTMLD